MDQSPQAVWDRCLDLIRDNISRQSFKTWFEPLKAIKLEEDGSTVKLTVQLPSRFYYEWLEEHYFVLLRKTIAKVIGAKGRLYYHIAVDREEAEGGYPDGPAQFPARQPAEEQAHAPSQVQHREPRQPQPSHPVQRVKQAPPKGTPFLNSRFSPAQVPAAPTNFTPEAAASPFAIPGVRRMPVNSQLNASYTFERFIEGDCNRLARSASLAIAQSPGTTSFNPFLVYGGVGLGKTHLIHAIGNHAKSNGLVDNVLYISSERFTNDFVQSIQHNRVSEFSLYYRDVDLLIVDDVQFFGGKEKTQEEFFHIFNALHQSGKQIVLSADRPPRDIEGIEERLLSRFQWGLSADVQMPELETRIAIMQRKAEDDGIDLTQDVIEFIAHNVKSNIRELEGALIRLLAHATLHRRDIDLALAKEVLRDLLKETKVNLSIEEIQRIACEYFKIPEDLVRAKTRKREVVQARQVAMYFCKHLTQHSLKTIGLHFGGRDHSTVIHANQSVEDQMETDAKFREMMGEIRRTIELRSR